MTRSATFVALLATFTILCHGAPLHNDRRDAGASSTTSSTPLSSATTSVTSATSATSSTSSSPTPSGTQNTVTSTASSASSSTSSSPSTGAQNATSTPVTNWTAFANGTRGNALYQLLTQGISKSAPQRWVTEDGISSTDIGGSDPGLSNKALEKAVNTAFGNGSNHRTYVELYWQFCIDAGNFSSEVQALAKNTSDAQSAYATEQVKLVRAYIAAHPGNVTHVGVNVTNVELVKPTELTQMEIWASSGGAANCTSSIGGNLTSRAVGNSTSNTSNATSISSGNSTSGGSDNCTYTADDYRKYSAARNQSNHYAYLSSNSNEKVQIALQGYQLKETFQDSSNIGIFNLSMDTGGSGAYTDFVPAWSATIIGWGAKNSTSYQTVESNLDSGLGDSTSNSTTIPGLGGLGGLGPRGEIQTRRSSGGFGALQFVAQGLSPTQSDKTPAPMSGLAATAPAAAAVSTSGDPLNQPLSDNQTLMLLRVQEGTWADQRYGYIQYIRFADRANEDVVNKYFGPGDTGSGPIGRHWTHLVLIVTTDSSQVSAQLFGKVYEVVAGLQNGM
ncbi:hypothetical protein DFH06DRAFT_540998 [Mycena polygramma]|nr:hypothetical protein DFH06DRAFT_540998 [Mycena polygramma]